MTQRQGLSERWRVGGGMGTSGWSCVGLICVFEPIFVKVRTSCRFSQLEATSRFPHRTRAFRGPSICRPVRPAQRVPHCHQEPSTRAPDQRKQQYTQYTVHMIKVGYWGKGSWREGWGRERVCMWVYQWGSLWVQVPHYRLPLSAGLYYSRMCWWYNFI